MCLPVAGVEVEDHPADVEDRDPPEPAVHRSQTTSSPFCTVKSK